MKVIIFGAGVQGTVYGVRLARAAHEVAVIATHHRAVELRRFGANIRDSETSETISASVIVWEELPSDCKADFCLVTVRREQLTDALISLAQATQIERFVFLVNHANGSNDIFAALGKSRAVLAFPGVAGTYDGDTICYINVSQQHTVVDKNAPEAAELFRSAGFVVDQVCDVDSWLKRRRFILSVREGWLELDRREVTSAPWPLRFLFCHAPLWFSVSYWSKLLSSRRGEIYFAAHVRRVPVEMLALASDVRKFTYASESPE